MKTKLLLLFVGLFLVSCSQIVDNIIEQKERDSYVSPMKGTYVGSYSGGDSGTLVVEVSSKDYVTVNRHSSTQNFDETFIGALIGQSFTQTVSAQSGFKISGNLISQNGIYKGTWTQSGLSGTWELRKK